MAEVKRVGVVLGTGHGAEGATGRLVEELLERVRARPALAGLDGEYVATTDLDLGPSCPTCLSCMTQGEQACPRFDPATAARELMDRADLVIFAALVHSFHVSATMKRFVDHFSYLIH